MVAVTNVLVSLHKHVTMPWILTVFDAQYSLRNTKQALCIFIFSFFQVLIKGMSDVGTFESEMHDSITIQKILHSLPPTDVL